MVQLPPIYGVVNYRYSVDHDDTEKHKSPRAERSRNDKVLERFRGVFYQQVAVIEQAKTALLAESFEVQLQQAARQEAHKLAGSIVVNYQKTNMTLPGAYCGIKIFCRFQIITKCLNLYLFLNHSAVFRLLQNV
jgi:hypothetical protein